VARLVVTGGRKAQRRAADHEAVKDERPARADLQLDRRAGGDQRARTVGGGGGKSAEIAVAGGRDPSRLDEALEQARRAAVGPA